MLGVLIELWWVVSGSGARPVGLVRGTGKAKAMARRATQLSKAALEEWARSLGTGVAAMLELEAWARSLGTGVAAALELEAWASSLGTGVSVAVFVSGKNGERNPAFGELSAQMRGAGVEHASRATCKTRRKDASTEQPEKTGDAAGF